MSKKKKISLPQEWFDEMPTMASPSKSLVVSFAVLMLGLMGLFVGWFGPIALDANYPTSDDQPALEETEGADSSKGMDVDDLLDAEATTEKKKTDNKVEGSKEGEGENGADSEEEEELGSPAETRAFLENAGYYKYLTMTLYAIGGWVLFVFYWAF